MSSASGTGKSGQSDDVCEQEFVIRVPKISNKKFNIMGFRGSMPIEFSEWSQAVMEREPDSTSSKDANSERPKYGPGTEYMKEERKGARMMKYESSRNKTKDQPWIIEHDKRDQAGTRKKYRGVREGGINENASYYIFSQGANGVFEAVPVTEWYKFQTMPTYKHLSYEEAEEAFTKRNNTFNYFDVMVRNRVKTAAGEEEEEEESPAPGKPTPRKLKKNKKPVKAPQKERNSVELCDEAFEDSDDGDGDGKELDYISSSESEPEVEAQTQLKSVAEEEAMRNILQSEDEDEDQNADQKADRNGDQNGDLDNDGDEENQEQEQPTSKYEVAQVDPTHTGKDRKKAEGKKPRHPDYGSSSESADSSSSSDFDATEHPLPTPTVKDAPQPEQPALKLTIKTSQNGKRKVVNVQDSNSPTKKPRLEPVDTPTTRRTSSNGASSNGASSNGASSKGASSKGASSSETSKVITEEQVRSYLTRGKPMTTTELLQKFKSKKLPLSRQQLTISLAQILKNIEPHKKTIQGKMYLSMHPFNVNAPATWSSILLFSIHCLVYIVCIFLSFVYQ